MAVSPLTSASVPTTGHRNQTPTAYDGRWGGNLIIYKGNTYTPNADIVAAKILFNSVISTKLARFLGIDLNDFYLGTPFLKPEYMLVPLSMIPQEMVEEYNILPLVHNGMVLAEISKGMYGLPQAGRIAFEKLKQHLASGGYIPTGKTPGLLSTKQNQFIFASSSTTSA